jgi:hypothetical protein
MVSMKRPAVVVLALACGITLSGTVAWAQTNSAYRSADAIAGKPQRLGVYGNVKQDCTSGPLPEIRVVTPPKHGELSVRSGTLKAGRITRCPKLEAKAQGVFYRANPKYTGPDEVGYEVKSASGKVEAHTVRITVKDTPPSGARPSEDTEL